MRVGGQSAQNLPWNEWVERGASATKVVDALLSSIDEEQYPQTLDPKIFSLVRSQGYAPFSSDFDGSDDRSMRWDTFQREDKSRLRVMYGRGFMWERRDDKNYTTHGGMDPQSLESFLLGDNESSRVR